MSSTHIPKGSMCTSCSNASQACGQRDFQQMRVLKTYPDGTQAVQCTAHQQAAAPPAPLCLGCGARHHHLPDGSLPCGH